MAGKKISLFGVIITLAVTGILALLAADTFVNLKLKNTLKEFKSLTAKINKENAPGLVVEKQKDSLEKIDKLQIEVSIVSKELENKTTELKLKEGQIQSLQEELEKAKSACGDPEKEKADELKLKLESALGIKSQQ
ncbi:MAG: hypothetical protein KJ880_05760 [Candidatus Omnitrophica bacterium]|nr:hypothetical protein [Candidatus Omnitrophota bacterium]